MDRTPYKAGEDKKASLYSTCRFQRNARWHDWRQWGGGEGKEGIGRRGGEEGNGGPECLIERKEVA